MQVQTGASDQNGHFAAAANIVEHSPCFALVISRREDSCWLADIDHVVRYAGPFLTRRFGRSNIEVTKNLDRIVVDDFSRKAFGKKKSELRFAASCRPNYGENWMHEMRAVAALYERRFFRNQ